MQQLTFDILTDPKLVKGLQPQHVNMFNNLSALWKASREGLAESFNERLLKRAVEKPNTLLRGLIPEGNPQAVRQLRMSLMEPVSGIESPAGKRLWEQVRTGWVANLMDDVIDRDAGTVKAGLYYRRMRRMGDAALNELFNDAKGRRGKVLLDEMIDYWLSVL